MELNRKIQEAVKSFFKSNFELDITNVELQHTRKEFEGDVTVVLFPFLKQLRKAPQLLGE